MLIWELLAIQIATFLGLVWVLRKIMYSASIKELKRLEELSRENEETRKELAVKIEEAGKIYERKIAETEAEANKLKAKTQEEIAAYKEEALAKARKESERIVQQAVNSKDRMREDVEEKLKGRVFGEAVTLLKESLTTGQAEVLHERLVLDFMSELSTLPSGTLPKGIGRAEIRTPFPLKPNVKAELTRSLSEKTGVEVKTAEISDPALFSGLCVQLGSFVIDGTLKFKLEESAEKLKKAL